MQSKPSISDAFLIDIAITATGAMILKESDHLLRRFGQVEFVVLPAKSDPFYVFRKIADEVWAVVEGEAVFELEDRRDKSPTKGRVDTIEISAKNPKTLLVPFGVACRISSAVGGKLVRICSHEDIATGQDELS